MVDWNDLPESHFLVEIRIIGDDREYMLQDITAAIIQSGIININSVNINTLETIFDGVITIKINNYANVNKIIEQIAKIDGVKHIEVVS